MYSRFLPLIWAVYDPLRSVGVLPQPEERAPRTGAAHDSARTATDEICILKKQAEDRVAERLKGAAWETKAKRSSRHLGLIHVGAKHRNSLHLLTCRSC